MNSSTSRNKYYNFGKIRMVAIVIIALSTPHLLTAGDILVPEHHATIRRAINAAREGDTITVAEGIYLERIKLKPRVTLRSKGTNERGKLGLKRAEATIIDGGGEAGDSPGITMAEGSILDGFTITRVGIYDEEKWQKHWDEKGANQPHEHIGRFGTPGIAIAGSTCTVTNNIVHHVGDTGIAIRGIEGQRCTPLVSSNICYRNIGGGIGSMLGSTATIDENICFENFYAGIGHDDASPLVIRNECYNNIRAGIGVSEGASPTVRENHCYENRRAGIGIRTGEETRPIIEDNDCHENGMAGIGCDEKASPVIRGNRCHNNKLAGIGCQSHSSPLIVDNHCYKNKEAGIGVNASNAVIIRNRIEKNMTAGIGITGEARAYVIDNTCLENRLVAIGIPNGGEAMLKGNTFARTGGMPPVVAILGGSKATLIENTIKGGGVAALILDGQLDARDNIIEGQNGGAGILAKRNSKAILRGNQISGYRKQVDGEAAEIIRIEATTQLEEPQN